jgi:hypothetical protein
MRACDFPQRVSGIAHAFLNEAFDQRWYVDWEWHWVRHVEWKGSPDVSVSPHQAQTVALFRTRREHFGQSIAPLLRAIFPSLIPSDRSTVGQSGVRLEKLPQRIRNHAHPLIALLELTEFVPGVRESAIGIRLKGSETSHLALLIHIEDINEVDHGSRLVVAIDDV